MHVGEDWAQDLVGLDRAVEDVGEVLERRLVGIPLSLDVIDLGTDPPHVEFALTEEGRSLAPVLQALYDWGTARAERTGAAITA
ncbi:winged helix-turn-helix transcriptional regulator [Dactylosporangium sp. CS-033363]|uniref:winged helix-turn-helix transcriptional regulator n=1 Tax=Dactylosporangium sp. CS-033363 TaxID=3239935 RepID=UPI003D94A36B